MCNNNRVPVSRCSCAELIYRLVLLAGRQSKSFLPVQRLPVPLPEPEHHEHNIVRVHGGDVAGQQRLFGQHPLYRGDWDWNLRHGGN